MKLGSSLGGSALSPAVKSASLGLAAIVAALLAGCGDSSSASTSAVPLAPRGELLMAESAAPDGPGESSVVESTDGAEAGDGSESGAETTETAPAAPIVKLPGLNDPSWDAWYNSLKPNETGYIDINLWDLGGYEYRPKWARELLARKEGADAVILGDDEVLPPALLKLGGKKISVTGYFMPIETSFVGATTFALMPSDLSCCFAELTTMNEWIYVALKPDQVVYFASGDPVYVSGTFEIGEKMDGNYVESLYRMTADSVVEAWR